MAVVAMLVNVIDVGGTGSVVAVAEVDGFDETPPFSAIIWK